jgi:hypothetical protein
MTSVGEMPHLTCPRSGKQIYGTLARAQHYADKLTAQQGHTYRPYQCPFCRWWHLTSRQRRGL